ncbi:Homocysteine S-methyltransferase [Granulosicoccus antarcticus IMCC3135]|uniref:Homocysteine S-methyltransferase n=2 Tax=Granulosicoccus TaxID=437504 RepID=A0A2Z2NW75_9GAMM|nr:Homocysteine S-methyltransferase [Granulosicoccus antarcticus IMCC3135]
MQNITLLDGGMGQELVRRSGKSPTPLWSTTVMLEQPELVSELHADFIRAGADVITVNAYTSTPTRLARDGMGDQFETLQITACQLAMQARDRCAVEHVKITGCLPPLVASYRPDLALSTDETLAQYRRICEVQARYVDVILCETMGSIAEAWGAATAGYETGKPVWLALSLDDNRPEYLRSGELLSEAIETLQEIPLQALLLNCSRPETITSAWETFRSGSRVPVGAYGNGFTSIDALQPGGTVSTLEARNDLGPDAYADMAMAWVEQGATLVGGCCEVGPSHIACLRDRLQAYKAG